MNPIRQFQRPLAILLVFIVAFSSLNCYSRFRMQTARLPVIKDMKDLQFIAIDASAPVTRMWILSNPNFEKEVLSARLDKVSEEFALRIATINTNAEKQAYKNLVLIYVTPPVAKSFADTLSTSLEYKNITKIEVFEPDAGKVIGNIFLGLGIAAGVVFLVVLAACNCPYVYDENKDSTRFEGVMYSGAIYPNLERNDWLPLPQLQPNGAEYRVRLSNEIKEVQHTNLLELVVLDHPAGVEALFDKYGQPHTLMAPQPPLDATDLSGNDVLPLIAHSGDDQILRGAADQTRPEANDGLILSFRKPANAHSAKLAINARNAPWLQYAYGKFLDEMGEYAPAIEQQYRKKSRKTLQHWMNEQQLPLAIWLEKSPGKWTKVDYFNMPGPTAFRKDVLQLDLSGIEGEEVRVKLEYGFMFWEIDWAAMDFSTEAAIKIRKLAPVAALDDKGADQTSALRLDDNLYYHQPNVGDKASITFPAPPVEPDLERSLFLHGKGHYELLHTPAPGKPNVFYLQQFKKPNALAQYSRELWNAKEWQLAKK